MANLRMIYDNTADRAVLTASSEAGALVASNMLTEIKSEVWRSTGLLEHINVTWPTVETFAGVMCPFCNLTSLAMLRVRTSDEVAATNLLLGSADLSNTSYWARSGTLTVAANAHAAPDGTNNMDTLSDPSGALSYLHQAVTVAAATNHTFTILLEQGTSAASRILIKNAALSVTLSGVNVAWSAGVPTLGGAFGGSYAIVDEPFVVGANTLYRISVTFDSSIYTSVAVLIYPDTAPGAGTLYAWGAQLETGLVATSYYPTTTTALARPVGYIDDWQSYQSDTGWDYACAAPPLGGFLWGTTLGANAFSYGGGTYGRVWLAEPVSTKYMRIDVRDSDNPSGYIEAGRLWIGNYFSPSTNADYGATVTSVDRSVNTRNDEGDLITDNGTKSRKINFTLSNMSANDRAGVWDILWGNGMAGPVLLSIFPDDADPRLEQTYQILGKLVTTPSMGTPFFARYSSSIDFEEV